LAQVWRTRQRARLQCMTPRTGCCCECSHRGTQARHLRQCSSACRGSPPEHRRSNFGTPVPLQSIKEIQRPSEGTGRWKHVVVICWASLVCTFVNTGPQQGIPGLAVLHMCACRAMLTTLACAQQLCSATCRVYMVTSQSCPQGSHRLPPCLSQAIGCDCRHVQSECSAELRLRWYARGLLANKDRKYRA
jgi:hypothetical protein